MIWGVKKQDPTRLQALPQGKKIARTSNVIVLRSDHLIFMGWENNTDPDQLSSISDS